MLGTVKKFLIGASVVASVSAIATNPALATTFSLSGNDVTEFKAVGSSTVEDSTADLNTILQGSCNPAAGACSTSPGGNVELGTSIDKTNNYQTITAFLNAPVTTLTGDFGDGTQIKLSSLTGKDWFTTSGGSLNISYGADNLATKWFNAALDANGFIAAGRGIFYNTFLNAGGFQRFSNPNPSYVNKDASGNIEIGLAGHYDATNLFIDVLTKGSNLFSTNIAALTYINSMRSANQQNTPLQASELINYSYGNQSGTLYNFTAVHSGLVNDQGPGADGKSHNGEYLLKVAADPAATKSVPEPSTIVMDLVAVGGVLVIKRKLVKKA